MRVAIYVQHLLGTGHLVRMQTLSAALHAAGHPVLLVSGGKLNTLDNVGYECVQLPVLKTLPGDFLSLLDDNGMPVSESWKETRAKQLIASVIHFEPDVVIVETWPFGRRQLQFELLPLVQQLGRMKVRPMIVSSVRDVLQQRQPRRRQQTLMQVAQSIDLVLVHGEQALTPLVASFEEAGELECEVVYSGYLSSTPSKSNIESGDSNEAGRVLVSAGGGATGSRLLKVASLAAEQSPYIWHLLAGPNLAQSIYESLRGRQSDNLIVERNRPDFQTLLASCAVSVSQFGYNTAIDIIMAGCPAVVIPYAEDGETEQNQRAVCFEQHGYVVSLQQEKLTPESLLAAIEKATTSKRADLPKRDLCGDVHSVQLLQDHYNSFRSQQE